MYRTLKKFFDFCREAERKQFYLSIFLGVFNAIFIAMRIPAVYVVIRAVLEGTLSESDAFRYRYPVCDGGLQGHHYHAGHYPFHVLF